MNFLNVERRQRRVYSNDYDKENVTSGKDSHHRRSSLPVQSADALQQQKQQSQQQQQHRSRQLELKCRDQSLNTTKIKGHSSDDSGVISFPKAPFSIYGDSPAASDLDQVMARIRRNTENANTSIKSSFLKDRDRNVVMAIPATKRDKPNITFVKKTIADKPKVVISRPQQPVFPRLPEINRAKAKQPNELRNKPTYLPLGESYHLDYTNDFIDLMMSLEEKRKLSPTFLKKSVTNRQRCLIVRYLLKVTTNCRYPSFTTYQAVKLFDSYIDKIDVGVDELQISALACLWIALKKDLAQDEIPEAWHVVDISGNNKVEHKEYKKSLLKCEQKVLGILKFEVLFAEPFSLLALYTVSFKDFQNLENKDSEPDGELIQNLYYFGSYMIDLAMMLEELTKYAAVHVAAVAAEISLVLLLEKDLSTPSWDQWRKKLFTANPTLKKYRLQDNDLNWIRLQVLNAALRSEMKDTDYNICYKKYDLKRYGAVSKILLYKVACIERCNGF